MALYPFETQLVVTSDSSHLVLNGASVTIYSPADTTRSTPLTLLDAAGLPLANPVMTSPEGFLPAFQATMPQVMWSGGGYIGYLSSYQGLMDEVRAIKISGVPLGGTDGQILYKDGPDPYTTRWANPPAASTGSTGGTTGGTTTPAPAPNSGGMVQFVRKNGSTWPARPTADGNVVVLWIGADPSPAIAASGTAGMRDNVDIRMVTP